MFRASDITDTEFNQFFGPVVLGDAKFDLSTIPGFPVDIYNGKKQEYEELEQWYSGEKLNEKQEQGGRSVEKYPIKLNPIRGACYKHSFALWGEVSSDGRPLAPAIFRTNNKELKIQAQDLLETIYSENYGRSLMLRNSLLSQIYGGCVFKVSYVPEERNRNRVYNISLEAVHPSNFAGIPISGDEFRLEKGWIIKAMSPAEALNRYKIAVADDEIAYYIEEWWLDYYKIHINGIVLKDANGNPRQGQNPFGFVPLTYIPHIRSSNFYGDSLISQNVTGLVEEINKRQADVGDAVSYDSHKHFKVTGASGRPEVYELVPGIRIIQLHSAPAITGKEPQPDMDEVGGSRAAEPMVKLVEQLYMHFRREAFVPAVADGEDEGAQRSAMTLAMRMWPLLSHSQMERVIWGDGLQQIDRQILTIAAMNGLISQEILKIRIERRFAPFLPRDREAFINELVARAGAKLGSIKHLLSLLEDVDNPEEEFDAILEEEEEMASVQVDLQKEATLETQEQQQEFQGKLLTEEKNLKKKEEKKEKSDD